MASSRGGESHRRELLGQAELGELPRGVGQDADLDSQLVQLGRGLEDLGVELRGVQRRRERQVTDATPAPEPGPSESVAFDGTTLRDRLGPGVGWRARQRKTTVASCPSARA